jgi:raffinose/stachyose/melibiose transport system substrate-binding protein
MMFSLVACGGKTEETSSEPTKAASGSGGSETATEGDISGKSLEIAVRYTGAQLEVFQKVVDDFNAQYNTKVTVSSYGDDYEATLKTRMASDELPDIFETHGWSILRYKEYLMDLSDQGWVKDYDDSALGVIKDTDGAIYVLMISELIGGTLVNLDVCEAAGVDPYSIYTWDDLLAACEQVKAAGYTPISNGIGSGELANIAGTYYSYQGEKYELSDSMLDGTFDWSVYKDLLGDLSKWIDNGYLYKDIATMTGTDFTERWAADKAAFFVGNDPGFLIAAKQLNADGNYAFLPCFASTKEGVQFVPVGEGDAFGVWKDTKNEEAAKIFLNYLATPEVTTTINKATGKISALTTAVESDNYGEQLFAALKEKYPNTFYENYWDRKYMPSGMWPIFGNAGAMLLADYSDKGIEAVIEYLSENFKDLYEQAHAK